MSDKFYLFNNEGLEKSILNDEKRNSIYNEDAFAENNGKIYYALNFNICHIINLHNFELEKLIKENDVASLAFYNYQGKLYYGDWREFPNQFPGFIYLEKKEFRKLIIRDNVIVILKSLPGGRVSEDEFYFVDL